MDSFLTSFFGAVPDAIFDALPRELQDAGTKRYRDGSTERLRAQFYVVQLHEMTLDAALSLLPVGAAVGVTPACTAAC